MSEDANYWGVGEMRMQITTLEKTVEQLKEQLTYEREGHAAFIRGREIEVQKELDWGQMREDKLKEQLATSEAKRERMRVVLVWLDNAGGLGGQRHAEISKVIDLNAQA